MMIYKSKITNNHATIINHKIAGMCKKTLGLTMVLYKYDDSDDLLVMESREFFKYHIEL